MTPEVQLDEADRIIIRVVEEACKRGVGRTFRSPTGQEIKVLAIDGKWVRIGYGPGHAEHLLLPRKIKEIATKTAMLMGRIK